jgi:hypothetical protein
MSTLYPVCVSHAHDGCARWVPEHLGYADPRGMPELRRAIADYLQAAQGVRCDAEQIGGCQQRVRNPTPQRLEHRFAAQAGSRVPPRDQRCDARVSRARNANRRAHREVDKTADREAA